MTKKRTKRSDRPAPSIAGAAARGVPNLSHGSTPKGVVMRTLLTLTLAGTTLAGTMAAAVLWWHLLAGIL